MILLTSPFWNEYPCFVHLKTIVKGINYITKIKGDKETLSNIPRLIFTSLRLMWPHINAVFQSIIVDLRSAITLGGALISFKALIIQAWRTMSYALLLSLLFFFCSPFGMALLEIYLNSERPSSLLGMKEVPRMAVYCKHVVAILILIFLRLNFNVWDMVSRALTTTETTSAFNFNSFPNSIRKS